MLKNICIPTELALLALLAFGCGIDLNDHCEDCDDWDWDEDGWCADLCDDVYDCGMDVRYYNESECSDYCDVNSSFWDCVDDCYEQYGCRAQVCIDACSR